MRQKYDFLPGPPYASKFTIAIWQQEDIAWFVWNFFYDFYLIIVFVKHYKISFSVDDNPLTVFSWL